MKGFFRFFRVLPKALAMAVVMGLFFSLIGLSLSTAVLVLGSPVGWLLRLVSRPVGMAVTKWVQGSFYWSWFILGVLGFVIGAWFGFTAAIRQEAQERSLRLMIEAASKERGEGPGVRGQG